MREHIRNPAVNLRSDVRVLRSGNRCPEAASRSLPYSTTCDRDAVPPCFSQPDTQDEALTCEPSFGRGRTSKAVQYYCFGSHVWITTQSHWSHPIAYLATVQSGACSANMASNSSTLRYRRQRRMRYLRLRSPLSAWLCASGARAAVRCSPVWATFLNDSIPCHTRGLCSSWSISQWHVRNPGQMVVGASYG